MAHIQGSSLGWGTHTPNYRLKLSRDPRISAWCRAVQVSPHAPAPFLTPHQPTCQARVTPFVFRTPPGADLHRFAVNRVYARCRASRVRVAQHPLLADWVEEGLSSSSALCSLASQRYPAQSYGGVRRVGDPSRVFRHVCVLQFGGLHYAPSMKAHSAGRRACESPKPSPGCLLCKHLFPIGV